jgi:hypothetical protein
VRENSYTSLRSKRLCCWLFLTAKTQSAQQTWIRNFAFSAPLRLVFFLTANTQSAPQNWIRNFAFSAPLRLENFTAKVHTQLNANRGFEYAQNTPSTPGYSPGEVCLLQE